MRYAQNAMVQIRHHQNRGIVVPRRPVDIDDKHLQRQVMSNLWGTWKSDQETPRGCGLHALDGDERL